MTLNDLKEELFTSGFVKSGRKYVLNGNDYNVILYMDVVPSLSIHRIMIEIVRTNYHDESETMAQIALESMFSDERFYIDDSLLIKEKSGELSKLFRIKFHKKYIPIIIKLSTKSGILEIYDEYLCGKGLITRDLKEDLSKFKKSCIN
ncbi:MULTISPECIES: hypothetical protein [Asticcacaulis]|uniref:hypothetical protein n=1 Tax=Asticcacaulis TaxID=76890 RepID=UPI001AE38A7E|nr:MULTISPECIES: hypothetical protein [Asticcacaulis]MBP2161258.1 hypothetical protein [Asticcacaulis solisilvae]MDR6802376.1 hypothetical protein [Asticcacaulis sp. BE141]